MYKVDVNKDVSSDFLFFSAFLDLQSIRDDEATTSKQLIFFNALTDVLITSQKQIRWSCKIWRAFSKISKNFTFRSFELLIIQKDSFGPWHVE